MDGDPQPPEGGRRDRARHPERRARRRPSGAGGARSTRPEWPPPATRHDPGADVPEADALEQQLAARPGEAGSPLRPVGDREANEADVIEQEIDVPLDDDEIPS